MDPFPYSTDTKLLTLPASDQCDSPVPAFANWRNLLLFSGIYGTKACLAGRSRRR